ncbi:RCC1 domain-containing protein [Bdellovibrio sp. HCB-162]|uniref:RCC1 domain-containing protein n=1 Tax=Bdellovibrio sp. HCB-162 TaxID=3394234 RepID=UPI0039BCDAFD
MRQIILALGLFFGINSWGQTPQFLDLKTNKSSYEVGERIVVMASVRTAPLDPDSEIYIESKWDGANMRLIKFTDNESAGVTPAMVQSGYFTWQVKAFLQNKGLARDIEISILNLEKEIATLRVQYDAETDSDKKTLLSDAIAENEQSKNSLQTQLRNNRILVETKELQVSVYESSKNIKAALPTFSITTSRPNGLLQYGEPGDILFKITPGTGGVMKNRFVASFDGYGRSVTQVDEFTYKLDLQEYDSTVGNHTVFVTLNVRNKRDSDSLLSAITMAGIRKQELEILRDSSLSSGLASYYQREIDDIVLITVAFNDVHILMETTADEKYQTITIEDAPATFKQVSAGEKYTCGIWKSGAYCWGVNTYGELGTLDTSNRLVPTPVAFLPTEVESISSGGNHACAIRLGFVYCWGLNSSGQLGDGTTWNYSYPVQVSSLPFGVKKVSAGESHTCALVNNSVYCWGSGSMGQIGNGGNSAVSLPTKVFDNAIDVAAGREFTCAINTDQDVYCWGRGYSGQLGNGVTNTTNTPGLVLNLTGATKISTGFEVACAISNERLYCWGSGLEGQMGNGSLMGRVVPTEIESFTSGVTEVEVGSGGVCAIVNSAAKCWGKGTNGALGDGQTSLQWYPVQVSGMTSNVNGISGGLFFGCGIQAGNLKCWGSNYGGNLGNGSGVGSHALTPVSVTNPE